MENTNLEDVAAAIGYTATRTLAITLAGKRLYLPNNPTEDCHLARLIGLPALRALCREFAGVNRLRIPAGDEDERLAREWRIAGLFAQGVAVPEIAKEFDLSERRVQQLRLDLHARGWLDYPHGIKRAVRRGPAPTSPPVKTARPVSLAEKIGNGGEFRRTPSPFPTADD